MAPSRVGDGARADPAVVAAWVAGWALSRGVGPPEAVHGGHYVEVGLPRHQARYVFASIETGRLRRLAETIADPWIFLKVCTPADALEAAWPEGWVVQTPGFMMTTELAGTAAAHPVAPAPGYTLSLDGDRLITASIMGADGALAASGKVALADGHATFDQIVTDENHRRRGLGQTVMRALGAAAVERGVRQAVLVATPMGRELYTALGWRLHAHYTTAVIPGPEE